MQQRVRHREVGAGQRLQVQVGLAGGGGGPGVHHDQPAAAFSQVGDVPHQRRHGLGRVRADQQQRVRATEVGQRERQPPVDPERPVAGRRGRGHAPAPVVVDVPRPQRHPGEAAQRVRLLVGQPAAAEDGYRVRPVAVLHVPYPGGDPVERLVPGRRAQLAAGPVAQQRGGEPVRVVEQVGGGPTLLAQPAPVGGEVPCAHLDAAVGGAQHHAALQGAVRAVRGGLRGAGTRSRRRACTVCHVGKACRRAVSGPGLLCFGPVTSASHRTRVTESSVGFRMWDNNLIY